MAFLYFSPLLKGIMDKNQFRDMREYMRRLDAMDPKQARVEVDKTLAEIRGILNPGRNSPCPCGAKDSAGKPIKFKKCCGK